MTSERLGRVVLTVFALLSVVATSCTTDELDVKDLEESLTAALQDDLGAAPAVDCGVVPDGLGAGDRTRCVAALGRSTFPVLVEMTASREVADVTVEAQLVDAPTIVELVGSRLTSELGETTIDCGAPIVAANEDGVIDACTAIDAAGTVRQLQLRLGADGGLDVELGTS